MSGVVGLDHCEIEGAEDGHSVDGEMGVRDEEADGG